MTPTPEPNRSLLALKEHLVTALNTLSQGEVPDLNDFDQRLKQLSGIMASKLDEDHSHALPNLTEILDMLARLSSGIARLQEETQTAISSLAPHKNA
jgi:ABC-type transporter Mla subunit MlaD